MFHTISDIYSYNPPYTEQQVYIEEKRDAQNLDFGAASIQVGDFGGYYLNGTATVSGTNQYIYIYYRPNNNPSPEIEIKIMNFDRLAKESQEVR